jgi:UDP-N-acetylglucosamine:LPS N-acetylglucosamine transferase
MVINETTTLVRSRTNTSGRNERIVKPHLSEPDPLVASIGTLQAPLRVLVVSTSMGAGHNGNAAELMAQLRDRGHDAIMIDQLDLLPWRVGSAVRGWYRLQLRFAPWSYEKSWRAMNRLHRFWAQVNGVLCWRRLFRTMSGTEPDLIVSNNPLGAQTLGHLKRTGRISTPVATFITDFGVHQLWVHAFVDVHLCVHPAAADEVGRLGGSNAMSTGPLVRSGFFEPISKLDARLCLGIASDRPVVLVTSGSWAVGEIEKTVRYLVEQCNSRAIVPCGNDHALRSRLQGDDRIVALGWTDDMCTLVASADVVVENAGGLSAMEAFAARRPVVTFRPIPGHGRHNAEVMARVGVVQFANGADELCSAITDIDAQSETVRRASGLFTTTALEMIIESALVARQNSAASLRGKHFVGRAPKRRRTLTSLAAMIGVYLLGTGGVGLAVAAGAHLAPRIKPAPHQAFVAVRLNGTQLQDPRVRNALQAAGVAVVVDVTTASGHQQALRELAAHGVPVASVEDQRVAMFARHRLRHHAPVSSTAWFSDLRVASVVTGGVNALDVAAARRSHTPMAVGSIYKASVSTSSKTFRSGRIYVEDERKSSADEAVQSLGRLREVMQRQVVDVVALGQAIHATPGTHLPIGPGPIRRPAMRQGAVRHSIIRRGSKNETGRP